MRRLRAFIIIVLLSYAMGQAQTTVTGRVTGADGAPMALANVFLLAPNDTAVIKRGDVDPNGRFKIRIDSKGIWVLRFTGVAHRYHDFLLYAEKPEDIEVNASLGTYHYVTDFDKVEVNGDFNRWYILNAIPMTKRTDGTYSASVKSDKEEVVYKLRYVRERAEVEGTQAERYVYDGAWGYNSVVPTRHGKAEIVFDPSKLIRSEKPAELSFGKASPVVSRFAFVFSELESYKDKYQNEYIDYVAKRRLPREGFYYDWSGTLGKIKKEIEGERVPIIRSELYLSYLAVGMIAKQTEVSFYDEVLKGIPPDSPCWVLDPHAIFYALNHSSRKDAARDGYVNRVIDENRSARVKSALLMDEFMAAKLSDNNEKARHYYDLLENRFGSSAEAVHIFKMFGNPFTLAVGNPAPSFSVRSMDDKPSLITNKKFKGKYLLIEFWAAEDKASVEQAKFLEEAWTKYKSSEFEILSISLDSSLAAVKRFRREKSKMAWWNAYLGKNVHDKTVSSFRAYEIPTAFLLDPKGVIIATGNDLLGTELDKTLSKFLPGR